MKLTDQNQMSIKINVEKPCITDEDATHSIDSEEQYLCEF